jgi:hypothetical protein
MDVCAIAAERLCDTVTDAARSSHDQYLLSAEVEPAFHVGLTSLQ